MQKSNIGKGSKMSIAKAGLKVFFEELVPEWPNAGINSGDLEVLHRIVDVAGAQHASVFTHHQVLSCLRSSPYWEAKTTSRGWLERRCNNYTPTQKGHEFYHYNLKIPMNIHEFKFPEPSLLLDTIPELKAAAIAGGFDDKNNPYRQFFNQLFFHGGVALKLKKGLPEKFKEDALEYFSKYRKSMLPKHEDKELVCAYLLSELVDLD